MKADRSTRTARELILESLHRVQPHYDSEIDEMELVLPGGAGREGWAVLVDGDMYVRLDVDTNEPLSIIIPGWHGWLARQDAPPNPESPAPAPRSWAAISGHTAHYAIEHKVRYSTPLAQVAVR